MIVPSEPICWECSWNTPKGESRLMHAYRKLQTGEWDDIVGPKPKGFDSMPLVGKTTFLGKRKPGRLDYTLPALDAIRKIVGDAKIEYLLFRWCCGGNDDEWLKFYVRTTIEANQIKQFGSPL